MNDLITYVRQLRLRGKADAMGGLYAEFNTVELEAKKEAIRAVR